MKKLLTLIGSLAYLLIASTTFAQAPQKFNYQGIARDVKGNPMSKQTLALKLSVLPASDATVPEYEETQLVTTNEFGLYTLQIGNGTAITGEMKTVKWETGNKYIKVAIDPTGGTNYVDAGTNQLLSVPYALYADKAGEAREGAGSTIKATRATNNYIEKTNGAGVANSTSLLYDNGSNIGMGTTAPAAKFHINGTGTNELRIQSAGGSPRLSFFGDAATGFTSTANYALMYKRPATDLGDFSTGFANSKLFIFGNAQGSLLFNTGGNVGFGYFNQAANTTTTNLFVEGTTGNTGIGTASPGAKLEVAGQVKITGGTPGAGKVLTSDATGLATWQTPVSVGVNQWITTGNDISNNNIGNVGIGNTSISSNAYGHGGTNKILEINNSASASNSQSQLVLSTDATAGGSIGGITFINKNTTASDQRAAFIGANFNHLNQDATDLTFWTREASGGLSQKMKIANEGTVRIEGPSTTSSGFNALSIGGYGDVGVDAPGNPNGRFIVQENGNTGIGTASPTVKLDINGSLGIRGNNSINFKDAAGANLGNNIYSSNGMLVLNGGNATNGNGVAINLTGGIINSIEFTASNINIGGDQGINGYVLRSKANDGYPAWSKPIEHNSIISTTSSYTITANNTILNDMTRTITIPTGQTSTVLVSMNANYLGYGCGGAGCFSFGYCEVLLNGTQISQHYIDLNPAVEGSFAIANLPVTLTAGTHTISFRIGNSANTNAWNIYPKSAVVFALPQ